MENLPEDMVKRVMWLYEHDYLPEMRGCEGITKPYDFLSTRQRRLEGVVNDIWNIELLR